MVIILPGHKIPLVMLDSGKISFATTIATPPPKPIFSGFAKWRITLRPHSPLSRLNQRTSSRNNVQDTSSPNLYPDDFETPPPSPSSREPPPPYEQVVPNPHHWPPTLHRHPTLEQAQQPPQREAHGKPHINKRHISRHHTGHQTSGRCWSTPFTRKQQARPCQYPAHAATSAQVASLFVDARLSQKRTEPPSDAAEPPAKRPATTTDTLNTTSPGPSSVIHSLSREGIADPAAGGSKKRMNSPSPDSDEPEKRPRKSARSESQVEDTDSSDDDTTPTFSMLEKQSACHALKGPNRDLDFAALKRRADIGVLAHPSVLRTFLGILGNRALLYDRSATQRPPEDPTDRYVLDVASSYWEEYIPGLLHTKFMQVVNSYRRHGGWAALQGMMCRSTERLPHGKFDFKRTVADGVSRLHQTIIDSIKAVKPNDGVPPRGT
ncbi:hypothetical protein PCASD_03246 [Puccinia coronata f. sp. avenae]|uniref:Uncharacterized protein n=1 Tax=Puccinia coronata f. sp. avenae TaxID=200324 RepID=A0A2N5VFH7_9BASI|nr:hypothetical protein PCASD_03246 [Puccinia coronata f. sp. avenae]